MPILLQDNSYGESSVRLLRVARQADHRDVKEATLQVHFEGDFEDAHARGENRKILPPGTIRNTVYALARQYPGEALEDFSLHLIEHFLTYNPQIARVCIEAEERTWTRISHGGKAHASAFTQAGGERRTTSVQGKRDRAAVRSGIRNLSVLKAANVGFEGFLRDPYTTLKESTEGVILAELCANWLYQAEDTEHNAAWHGVRQTLLEIFAEHGSRSFPHTLYAMGEAILASFDSISEIALSIWGEYCMPADLTPLGMDNPGRVFLPSDAPRAIAEATLRRK